MSVLDINQLIQESVSGFMKNTTSDETINDAFLNSIVEEVKNHPGEVTLPILKEAFADVFENEEHIEALKEKFNENGIQIPEFNIQESEDISDNPYSTTIGLITSGLGVRAYRLSKQQ